MGIRVAACVAAVVALAVAASPAAAIQVKIVGGHYAAPGQFPWMAGLVSASASDAHDGLFCGASVIAPRVVITASHCLEETRARDVDVVVGRTRMSSGGEGERVRATKLLLHPRYNPRTARNDVALVQLARPVSVSPINLPAPEDASLLDPGDATLVSGWGTEREGARTTSDDLQFVGLTVRPMSRCADRYAATDVRTQICAAGAEGEDSCQGDSGGPLFAGEGAGARLLGLVSYGDGCARKDVPGVYTRVSGFGGWVRDNAASLNADAPPPPPPPADPPRVRIGTVTCGAVTCDVELFVTGRAPAGGIVVDAIRAKTRRRPRVERAAFATQLEPGRWRARVNLPVGRVILYAFPLNAARDDLDGRGAVTQLRITQG